MQFSIIQGTRSETLIGKTQQTWEAEDILLRGGGGYKCGQSIAGQAQVKPG